MKAIILVGGEGTRLRPLTINRLKGTVPMAGHPFLNYQFKFLKKHGIKEVVLSICHMPEKIKKTFGTGEEYGMKLHYAVEKKPLGTAGAIKNAQRFMTRSENLVIMNGDVLTDLDLAKMLNQHQKKKGLFSLGLTWVADPSAYGVVQFDANKRIERFIEKPSPNESVSHWINAGIYIANQDIFNWIPDKINYSAERALFPDLLANGQKMLAFPDKGYWNDIGTPGKYLQSNIDILEGRMFMLKYGTAYKKKNGLRIGRRCVLAPSVKLIGPAVIGDGCRIEDEVLVGESCALDDEVVIGRHCRLERAVVWDHTRIGEGTTLTECVVGRQVTIGKHVHVRPGTVLADHSRIPDYSIV